MKAALPVLIISRSAEQERRIQRDGLVIILGQACNVALCLIIAVFLAREEIAFSAAYTPLPVIAACFGLYAMYGQLRWRQINRRMRNLQLALTEQGLTYASAAGTYSAPWSAVRRIRLQDHRLRASYLIVDVRDWGGPVGRAGRLVLPIHDCGIGELQLRQAIHELSGGTVMATRK